MDSYTILENYLISKSSFEQILSIEQFTRLFPKNVSERRVNKIYESLERQQRARVAPIKDNIRQTFDIPVENIARDLDTSSVSKLTLSKLVESLENAEQVSESQVTELDKEIEVSLKQINVTIDELSDLRYGKSLSRSSSKEDLDDLIKQTKTSAAKCESFFYNK